MRSQAFLPEVAGFANIKMEGASRCSMAGRLPRESIGKVLLLGVVEEPFSGLTSHVAVVRAEKADKREEGCYHYVLTSPVGEGGGMKVVALDPGLAEEQHNGVTLHRPASTSAYEFGAPDLFVPSDQTHEPARWGDVAVRPFVEFPDPNVDLVLGHGLSPVSFSTLDV